MKRALVSTQKGIFCKPIGRLFEAKRASFQNEDVKNNYIRCKEWFWSWLRIPI